MVISLLKKPAILDYTIHHIVLAQVNQDMVTSLFDKPAFQARALWVLAQFILPLKPCFTNLRMVIEVALLDKLLEVLTVQLELWTPELRILMPVQEIESTIVDQQRSHRTSRSTVLRKMMSRSASDNNSDEDMNAWVRGLTWFYMTWMLLTVSRWTDEATASTFVPIQASITLIHWFKFILEGVSSIWRFFWFQILFSCLHGRRKFTGRYFELQGLWHKLRKTIGLEDLGTKRIVVEIVKGLRIHS